MKFYQETTDYGDEIKNGIYLLNDSKSKMYAYVSPATGEVKAFKNPIGIYTKGRSFQVVKNTFNFKIPSEQSVNPTWEIEGSKGNKYIVEKTENGLTCTCSGFKFRGVCKHVESIENSVGTGVGSSVAAGTPGLVRNHLQISRRRTG
jgi:hypothetical protein